MKQLFFLLSLMIFSLAAYSQSEKIEWSENYRLQESDFRAPAPNTGSTQTVNGHYVIEYRVPNYKLLLSKNFNEDVTCSFYRDASWLDKGEFSQALLRYAQSRFDLAETAARKIRKQFSEERGKLAAGKAQEIYDAVISELTTEESRYSKETNFGQNDEAQIFWEKKIQEELAVLADFCKYCKPEKQNRKLGN